MSTIVTRAGKGSPLTNTELDANFSNLNADKYESGSNVSVGTLAASGAASFAAGSASAPAITRTGDLNTGMYFPTADTIAFAEGGTESMRLDSSGNVGIGTTSPVSIGGHSGVLTLYGANATALVFQDAGGRRDFRFDDGALFIRDSVGNALFRFDSNNQFGVGGAPNVWAAGYRIAQVGMGGIIEGRDSDAAFAAFVTNGYLANTGNWTYITTAAATRYYANAGVYVWQNAASGTAGNTFTWTERMRLDASGNLGIGTATPDARLSVAGSSVNFSNASGSFDLNLTGTAISSARLITSGSGYGDWRIQTGNTASGLAGALRFFDVQASLARLTLDLAGNLGLGVTPSAWSLVGCIELGGSKALAFGNQQSFIVSNAYFNSGWVYKTSNVATMYSQDSGDHRWFSAASGTAGNAVSFAQRMTLFASGGLALGHTTDPGGAGRLRLSGVLSFTADTISGAGATFRYISGGGGSLGLYYNVPTGGTHSFAVNESITAQVSGSNFVVGNAAIATNATDGFLYVPSCAGTPTGTPATFTGRVPIVVDTTNNKLYFYSGGQWRDAGP